MSPPLSVRVSRIPLAPGFTASEASLSVNVSLGVQVFHSLYLLKSTMVSKTSLAGASMAIVLPAVKTTRPVPRDGVAVGVVHLTALGASIVRTIAGDLMTLKISEYYKIEMPEKRNIVMPFSVWQLDVSHVTSETLILSQD